MHISSNVVATMPECDLALLKLAYPPQTLRAPKLADPVIGEPVYSKIFTVDEMGSVDTIDAKVRTLTRYYMGEITIFGTILGVGDMAISLSVPNGKVTSVKKLSFRTNIKVVYVHGWSTDGTSGAPVFNSLGEVVGIIYGGGDEITFVISSNNFSELLRRYEKKEKPM